MANKKVAARRRRLANNPAVHPGMRWYMGLLNRKGVANVFGTTTTTTSTTSTTTTTTTTTLTTTTSSTTSTTTTT